MWLGYWSLLTLGASLAWHSGAALPLGIGGHAAAALGGKIVVVGGTTWEKGQKRWLREARSYDPGADCWQECGALPAPVGYAVGIAGRDCLYLIGGSDGARALTACIQIRVRGDRLWLTALPDLPACRVYAAGDRIGRHLYVVGGSSDLANLESATATLFCLDLDHPEAGWQTLAPLPGRARTSLAAVACGGFLYVFGGAYLTPAGVENFADAYRYRPETGRWERLPDAPYACRGWSALTDGNGGILLCGGYNASAAASAGKDDAFGFTAAVLRYDTRDGSYRLVDALPRSVLGATPVSYGGQCYFIGGEPARRQRGDWIWRAPWTHRTKTE